MAYKAVIHYPDDPKDSEKLLLGLARFRAAKTIRYLASLQLPEDATITLLNEVKQEALHKSAV